MKDGTPEHPKTLALATLLEVPRPIAVGVLELLWHFAAKYAPRGDVGRFSDAELAAATGWTEVAAFAPRVGSAPSIVVEALLACRWLDRAKKHRLIVHDWPEHCAYTVHNRLARARLFFADGTAPNTGRLSGKERQEIEEFYRAHGERTASARRRVTVTEAVPEAVSVTETYTRPNRNRGARTSPTIAAARSACRSELEGARAVLGVGAAELLAAHSRTPGGQTITNVDTCTRAEWLDITAARLRAAREAAEREQAEAAAAGSTDTARNETLEFYARTASSPWSLAEDGAHEVLAHPDEPRRDVVVRWLDRIGAPMGVRVDVIRRVFAKVDQVKGGIDETRNEGH